MATRLVRARPRRDRLDELHERLTSGELETMEPFGRALSRGLERARFDPEAGTAVWIEEDYCRPPLAMERAAVLDAFFEDITIVEEDIDETMGWSRIDDLPGLWEAVLDG